MRKIHLFSLLMLAVLVAGLVLPARSVARAQNTIGVDNLKVDIWPEYDRTSVLVIYHMSLSAQTELPATIRMRIPRQVESPVTIAFIGWDNNLYNIDFNSIPEGDWQWVEFNTPYPDFQIEYYDPRLTITDGLRTYQYVWPGDFPVDDMTVSVQQPLNAFNMSIDPSMGDGRLGTDGLIYYTDEIGRMRQDKQYTVDLSYEMTIDTLSSPLLPVQASQPVQIISIGSRWQISDLLPAAFAGAGSISTLLTLVIVVLVLLVLIAILSGFVFLPGRSRRPAQESDEAGERPIFCHRCGRRCREGDLFCRTCGTRLKNP